MGPEKLVYTQPIGINHFSNLMNTPFYTMKKIPALKATALLLSLWAVGGCAKNSEVDASITSLVVSNPDFQLLEDAAVRGNVAVLLGNKNAADPQGNFTVFAPTNTAFNRLGVRIALDLQAIQPDFLQKTLFYHVFSGSLPGSALTPGSTSPSALGPTRRIIQRADGSLYVNGARILGTDVSAANGLVHTTDKLLLATGADVVQSAIALSNKQVFTQPELTYLVAAVVKCGLVDALSAPGPYTVFAPTDQAFRDTNLPHLASVAAINAMTPAQVAQVSGFLTNGVLVNTGTAAATQLGNQFTSELPENTAVTAFSGRSLTLGPLSNGALTVKFGTSANAPAANMVISDVQCTNGVVHIIDRVLRP